MRISLQENVEKLLELTLLNLEDRRYLPHYGSDQGFKGTVVNRTLPSLHGGSLENTRTVPLITILPQSIIVLSNIEAMRVKRINCHVITFKPTKRS